MHHDPVPGNIFIAQCLIPHLLSGFGLSWTNFPLNYSMQIIFFFLEWNCSGNTADELDFVIEVIKLGQTRSLALYATA